MYSEQEVLKKMYETSMPLINHDDLRMKLICYGCAYVDLGTRLKNYSVVHIREEFNDNIEAGYRMLKLTITYVEDEIEINHEKLN